MRRLPGAKPLLAAVSAVLIAYSLVMVSVSGEGFRLPAWLSALGWGLLPISVVPLLYSLFMELPFIRTYLQPGPGPYLVTTGTYALVRHPTVLWYGLLLVSLLLLTHSWLLLMAAPLWLALDVLWMMLQERISLPDAFPEYEEYRGVTPMLVPNTRSLRAFFVSFRTLTGARQVR